MYERVTDQIGNDIRDLLRLHFPQFVSAPSTQNSHF